MKRMEGVKKGLASREAARIYWKKSNVSYRAMTIIKWAKEFLSLGKLSNHKQGVHAKRKCFLNDSDVKEKVLQYLRSITPAERSLIVAKKFIDETILPTFLGVSGTQDGVSEATMRKYFYEWGYGYRKNEKTIYFDGHEREDVVLYRKEWCKRMLSYMEKMDFYTGENEEKILEPNLEEGEKRYVFVLMMKVRSMQMMTRKTCGCLRERTTFERKGPVLPSWSVNSNAHAMEQ